METSPVQPPSVNTDEIEIKISQLNGQLVIDTSFFGYKQAGLLEFFSQFGKPNENNLLNIPSAELARRYKVMTKEQQAELFHRLVEEVGNKAGDIRTLMAMNDEELTRNGRDSRNNARQLRQILNALGINESNFPRANENHPLDYYMRLLNAADPDETTMTPAQRDAAHSLYPDLYSAPEEIRKAA